MFVLHTETGKEIEPVTFGFILAKHKESGAATVFVLCHAKKFGSVFLDAVKSYEICIQFEH